MTANDIKKVRKRMKLSREKFAALIKASAGSVQNWETKGVKPSPHFIERIQSLESNNVTV